MISVSASNVPLVGQKYLRARALVPFFFIFERGQKMSGMLRIIISGSDIWKLGDTKYARNNFFRRSHIESSEINTYLL